MSRVALALILIAVLTVSVWPATATIFEASGAISNVQNALDSRGFSRLAEVLDGWPGSRSIYSAQGGGEGRILDPNSNEIPGVSRDVARPLHLALETLSLVLLTEILCLPVGVAIAWFLFRSDMPGARLWIGVLIIAALIPLPIYSVAWLGAFGNLGRIQVFGSSPILVGRLGAAVLHAMAAIPWTVLIVGVGLVSAESEVEESARLDRSRRWVVIHVTLRRAIGEIAASALVVAVLTAGDMSVTDLLQIRTYAEEVYLQSILGENPASSVLTAIVPLLVLGPLIWIMARNGSSRARARIASVHVISEKTRLGRSRGLTGILLGLILAGSLVLPLYCLVWRAGRVGGDAVHGMSPHWSPSGFLGTLHDAYHDSSEALLTSLIWSSLASTLVTVLAWTLSWYCRGSRFWRMITLMIISVGLAAPGPVVGMAIKIAYRSSATISDTPAIVVIGLVSRFIPFAILILWPIVRSIPRELLETAEISGYTAWGRIRNVAVPDTLPAMKACWAAVFALCVGELSVTNLLLPPGMTTISMRVWTLLHTGVESHLAGVTLIMLGSVACVGYVLILCLCNFQARIR